MDAHPYASLSAERFWRKAVVGTPPFALDPSPGSGLELSRHDKVATAGSCFAQHLSRALAANGFTPYEAEPSADGLSGRYGNIYTTRQLLQLFGRAFGTFRPSLTAWRREDGRFVDPFRPRAEPDGFASPDEVVAARDAHLAAVRRMFEEIDALVFTLGLTEGWRHRAEDAALPLPPGVAGGEWDPEAYRFVNATVGEMTADLLAFFDGLRAVNPRIRLILTVSPVAITATYEPRHVLVSNTYSKAALRVAADEACRARDGIAYFPAYEIAVAPPNLGRYLSDDLRAINPAGVAHVMRVFFAGLDREAGQARGTGQTPAAGPSRGAGALDVGRESAEVSAVICDEELLDA